MDRRISYVARKRVHLEPDHLTIERGDLLMHDPYAQKLTVYREGNIVFTTAMTRVGMESLVATKIAEPELVISGQVAAPEVLTQMQLDIVTVPADQVPEAITKGVAGSLSPIWAAVAKKLLDAKRTAWHHMPIDQVPGKTIKNKQGNLKTAMRNRKLEITTRVREGRMWFHVKDEKATT